MIKFKCPTCGKTFNDELDAEDCIDKHLSQIEELTRKLKSHSSEKSDRYDFILKFMGKDFADYLDRN